MGSNYIAEDAFITPSVNCVHDSSTGYSADFSKNGDVDSWKYYDGIHTYGCWGGFLFGTLYTDYGTIGRFSVFAPVDATAHYFVRITMKYNPETRDTRGIHPLPTQGKIRWRTLSSTNWDTKKEKYFTISADNKWHTYILNMGTEQWWQGDVNDLRIWPAASYGEDGDEFFIRAIDIFSVESHQCKNTVCEKYDEYSHPCPWIGERATYTSSAHESGASFDVTDLSEFIIDINDYGNEIVKVKEVVNGSGQEVANALSKAISRTNIGGYAEVQVEYTTDYKFKIYSGTITDDSSIEITNNSLTRYLKFFETDGTNISTSVSGTTPVDGYSPLSSFKIKTHQALGLFDNNEKSSITFNPFQYSVEGGRRDWLESSTGIMSAAIGNQDGDESGQVIRTYFVIDSVGKTIIDYNHPFNASGRITKIWVMCTLDKEHLKSKNENTRKSVELSNAKVMIVRPKRDGTVKIIHQWSLTNRDSGRTYGDPLYSLTQEAIDLDVDVFINKGDMLAVYNANMYVGKSVSGSEYDCQYHQVSGKPSGSFDPGSLNGNGSAGLLIYAHGDDPQRRLYLDIDLRNRYNIEKINVKGEALNTTLEYNIARCLDIDWECELFGYQHWTFHKKISTGQEYRYQRTNTYYGLSNLNDGLYSVPDGLACDSFSITYDSSLFNMNLTAGPGIIPTNPYYFWVNGDEEWIAVWLHAQTDQTAQAAYDFDYDPVAIYMHFPYGKEKKIYKSKIYFKEKFNFRSFALSTYGGNYYTSGDADDAKYDLIPAYETIILDNVAYYEDSPTYSMVGDYLFKNPCTGHMISEATSKIVYEWDPILSDVVEDFSGGSGYFTYQTAQVTNAAEWQTARKVDWQILQHEWDPITCKGFRIYCDFHKSTKITEIELYGVAEDIGSSLAGSVEMTFSNYGDEWWPTESTQNTTGLVEVFIGDSPRYFTLELIPITETRYDDVILYVKTEDIYAGTKGCEYVYYADHAKTGVENKGQLVKFKNNYGQPYDLSLDIAPGKLVEEGLVYFSKLNGTDSITSPVIGPDSKYHKLFDYSISNQDYNCAINCHTFGLNNLLDGAKAYYTYDDMLNWSSFGTLSHGTAINFNNLPSSVRTVLYLPVISRNRYWKFGLINVDVDMNVREVKAYDSDGNLLDPEYYHDLNKTFLDAPVSERAPHLENISVVGSYYDLDENQYITADLGSQVSLGRIEIYHDTVVDFQNFVRTQEPIIGIDKYTRMCLRAWKDNTGGYLNDVSYYEHDVTMYGSTYIDTVDKNISLHEDMGCLTDWAEWKTKTNSLPGYTSVFNGASASGTVISGACEYPGYVDFDLYCGNRSIDAFWLDLREDASTSAWKMWQHLPFEITFKVNISSHDSDGDFYDNGSFSVGVLGDKQVTGVGTNVKCNLEFYPGVQMVFEPGRSRFGLAVRRNQAETDGNDGHVPTGTSNRSYTYTTGLSTGTDYYCKLTCYGLPELHRDDENILYRAEVWTDAIDGSNRIVNLTRNTWLYWEAYKFGIASCCYMAGSNVTFDCNNQSPPWEPTRIQGTVTDLQLNVDTDIKPYPFRESSISNNEKCSIRIPDGTNNYVKVENSFALDVLDRYHTHDLWVKFNSLPAVDERFTLMEQYNYDNDTSLTRGWRLALYNTGSWYRFEWWTNRGEGYGYSWTLQIYNGQGNPALMKPHINIVKDKWYFLVFSSGKLDLYSGFPEGGFHQTSFMDISGRAVYDISSGLTTNIMYPIPGGSDIIIGKNFDGWICEPRISRANSDSADEHGGHRYYCDSCFAAPVLPEIRYDYKWETPAKTYTRMYPFSFYVSDSNTFFGHYANVDAMFSVADEETYLPDSYYFLGNEFSRQYNTYFAIDLGHRFDVDLVRRYGANDDHFIDRTANVTWSNINTDNPYTAFMTPPTFDTNDDFYGYGGELIDKEKWYLSSGTTGNEIEHLNMSNGRLEQMVDSDVEDTVFYSTYGIRGDFDIQIKCGKISAPSTLEWYALFRVDMSDGENGSTYVNSRMEYRGDGYVAKAIFYDDNASYTSYKSLSSDDVGLRIQREDSHFFVKYYENGSWHELDDRDIIDSKGKDVYRIQIGLHTKTNYPTTKIYWKNFEINQADKLVMRSLYWDARWMAIEMLSGDGTSRSLEKIGIYPDITKFTTPSNNNYNSSWTDLGPSVTGYSTGTNIALGTTVSGSSYIGSYLLANVTDGVVDNTRAHAWLSDNSSEQWLLIDLGQDKQIYRVKVYHGYDTVDSDFLVEDYRIESSTDGQTFTTRWTISGNTSFTRTHDKATPFTARYIRLYITSYTANGSLFIKESDGINYYEWKGACLRELEVYEYYGYSYISSEEWPIVAINLRDQFYIQGHSLIGLYAEDTSGDWDNSASNFAWSDSIFQDAKKVTFSSWGATSDYEQWVAIKKNTATYHNSGPDYLKHALIESETKENPINYPWWWSSNISTLSRDYDTPVSLSTSSLRIDYPASTALDTVQFIEGSNWGVDSNQAYRDSVSFRWYIEDVDKLDLTEGYVFFGGVDGANSSQPVEYRWYFSTFSGTAALQTGWNKPFFRFKDADATIYNEDADPFSEQQPLLREYTTWQTAGLKFKGKGDAFTMNIDGFVIKRNHFEDASKFDYGLYLSGSDYLDCPLGELDLKAGTIEFWLRPDYTFAGLDEFNRFKNRSLFHFGNVANDVFGCMISSEGINVYYGNLVNNMRALLIKGIVTLAIDNLFHIAVSFSANGENLDIDNSTIKFYINGSPVASNYDPWDYTDEKLFKFTLGGKSPLAMVEHSSSLTTGSVDGVISNLRIYNYCKSNFTDSMNNDFDESVSDDLLIPSKMIEISQDNVTYYKVGDAALPFLYEKVPSGNSVQIYVRSTIPGGLTGKEGRTAGILASWDIGV